jgi:hypothetical protein
MNNTAVTLLTSAVGIVSSSIFFAMNHTLNQVAFPILFLGEVPKSTGSPASSKFFIPATNTPAAPVSLINRQWKETYERGLRIGLSTAIISTVAFSGAAYISSSANSTAMTLFITAAVSQISTGPYTWFVIFPINNILHRRADEINADKMPTVKSGEPDTFSLIKTWLGMNNTRANLGGLSVCLGIAGLLVLQL